MGFLNSLLHRTIIAISLTSTLTPPTTTAFTIPSLLPRHLSPSSPDDPLSTFFTNPSPSPPLLDPRDVTFDWYHHAYTASHLRQWTYGSTTESYNISLSECLHLSDQIGTYTTSTGTTHSNATLRTILHDLVAYNTSALPSRESNYAARVLENAQLALEEAEHFLTNYALVPQDPATAKSDTGGAKYYSTELRRKILAAPGTRSAIIVKVGLSTGIAMGAQGLQNWAAPNATWAPYAAVGGAAAGIAMVFSIIDLLQQEQMVFAPFEAVVGSTRLGKGLKALEGMIASVFLSVFRRMIRLAVGRSYGQSEEERPQVGAGGSAAGTGQGYAGGSGSGSGGGGGSYTGGGSSRGGGAAGGRGGAGRDPFAGDPYGAGDDPYGAGGDPYGIGGGSVGYGGAGDLDYGGGDRYGGGGNSRYGGGGGSRYGGGGGGYGGGGFGGGGFGGGSRGTSYGGYAAGGYSGGRGGPNWLARLTRPQVETVAQQAPYLSDERVGLLSYEGYDQGTSAAGGAAGGAAGAAAGAAGAAVQEVGSQGSEVSEYFDCPV